MLSDDLKLLKYPFSTFFMTQTQRKIDWASIIPDYLSDVKDKHHMSAKNFMVMTHLELQIEMVGLSLAE